MDKQILLLKRYFLALFICTALIYSASSLSLRKENHQQTKHALYKDNLEVQNWYYGNFGPVEYRLKIFKVATNNTLDICPITSPFSSSDFSRCENCPLQTPLRNLATSQCQPCPSGQVYNPNSGNCSLPLPTYTPSAQSNGNLDNITNQTSVKPKQVVPSATVPYAAVVNTTSVTNTTSTNYQSSGGASSWGDQSAFIPGVNQTSTVSSNVTTNTSTTTNNTAASSSSSNMTTSNNTTVNASGTNTSGSNNNSSNTSTVINPTNSANKTAVQPQSTNTTSNATNVTVPVLNYTQPEQPKIFNNSIVSPTNTRTTTNTTNSSSTTTTTTTNNSLPSNITVPRIDSNTTAQGNQLYNCSSSQPYFNRATNACEACRQGQQYIGTSNACLPEIWKININDKRYIQPSPGYVDAQIRKIQFQHPFRNIRQCPLNAPYLILQNQAPMCISCNQSQYFAIATKKCVDGCPQGTIYNQTDRVCGAGKYQTNPNSKNIASPTMKYNKWKQDLSKLQNVSPVVFCPQSTPFSVNGVCISCPNDKPYFDIEGQQCMGCKEGKLFSENERRCKGTLSPDGQTQKYSKPSLQRMFVNLF